MKPTLDLSDLQRALSGRPAGDAGATVYEIVVALGKSPTKNNMQVLREKMRPLVESGQVVSGTAIRKQINGMERAVPVYRLAAKTGRKR